MRTKEKDNSSAMDRVEMFIRDADWSTDELREQLTEEGIDPDEVLQKVKERIKPFLSGEHGNLKHAKEGQPEDTEAPNLLSLIRKTSTDTPSKIAQNLGVTVPFLKSCSDHADEVPDSCKNVLIDKATNVYSIDKFKAERAVRHPGALKKAALRDKPYTYKKMTFEEIVKTSGMVAATQQYWLDLAKTEKQ